MAAPGTRARCGGLRQHTWNLDSRKLQTVGQSGSIAATLFKGPHQRNVQPRQLGQCPPTHSSAHPHSPRELVILAEQDKERMDNEIAQSTKILKSSLKASFFFFNVLKVQGKHPVLTKQWQDQRDRAEHQDPHVLPQGKLLGGLCCRDSVLLCVAE